MTPDEARQRCLAAKLTVLDVATVGKQVAVTVRNYDAGTKAREGRTDAVVKKLGVGCMVSFGGGSGAVKLYFAGKEA